MDNEAGNFEEAEIQEVLMLGQRRPDRIHTHPGKFEVYALFSPPRVSAAASAEGLRGGWSLDLECVDPITGAVWDLTDRGLRERCGVYFGEISH